MKNKRNLIFDPGPLSCSNQRSHIFQKVTIFLGQVITNVYLAVEAAY